ncbi:MAG: hypothetical protein DDT37_00693 [Firmicutes bacterium]|nr:hypothetical protein [candidate division NPL-UPA2 bacterium]
MSLRSMTGFARVQGECELGLLTVEMRSVNHRYLDLSLRIPRELAQLEEEIKVLVREKVARGRVEISLKLQSQVLNARPVVFNEELLREYRDRLTYLAGELGLDPMQNVSLNYLLSLPGVVVEQERSDDSEASRERAKELIALGLSALLSAREQEGKRLCDDLVARLAFIKCGVDRIDDLSRDSVSNYRQRLLENIKRLTQDTVLDQNRLELEVALFADRANITEEVVRLNTHLHNFRQFLSQQAVGRKMDFYLQEMNREVNTLGSKSGDVAISQVAVDIKAELEKIREQVQNLE